MGNSLNALRFSLKKGNYLGRILIRTGAFLKSVKLKDILNQCASAGSRISIEEPYTIFKPRYVSIGNDFIASGNLRLLTTDNYGDQTFSPDLSIGHHVFINAFCHIACAERVTIGNHVLIASKVYISDHTHGQITTEAIQLPPSQRPLVTKAVTIEDNVWIGEGVSILMGVTIGKNCIIGAHAVVNKSFPENSVIAGIPARLIKTL